MHLNKLLEGQYKMEEVLVSVLIPVYNVENYLEKCLESIINQTLSDIEIICVNDGSTDDSLSILQEYQKKDKRIIIIDKENGGLPSARNAALDVAKGKYVGFVDSDDYVETSMFQKLYETAEKEKSEIVVCGAHIFPEKPRANNWYYKTLSPNYQHYEECTSELLFKNESAMPFIWRAFVKRSLIEENQLRLREDICLGEDRAFLTKIYLKAKGITLIPDKLYHYCWYREGSMMNAETLEKSVDKVKKHIKLVEHVADIIEEENDQTKYDFLAWSIPFIYGDYIYLPAEERKQLVKNLLKRWGDIGYYKYRKKMEPWVIEQFQYFEKMLETDASKVDVSIIIQVEGNAEHIEETLKGLHKQTHQNIEIIVINNGASDWTYSILHKYLFKDCRIRLYNTEKISYAKALNKGIALAKGEYITFSESNGWYRNNEVLAEWYQYAKKNESDVCASVVTISESNKFNFDYLYQQSLELVNERQYYDSDVYNCLYRKDFIKNNKLRFQSCSILTGKIFLIETMLKAKSKSYFYYRTYIQQNRIWPTWISEKKCEKITRELCTQMKVANEMNNANAIAKILTIINGDMLKNILLNSVSVHNEIPEEREENVQISVIKNLYEIIRLANPKLLQEMGYDVTESQASVLSELIKRRQFRLAEL